MVTALRKEFREDEVSWPAPRGGFFLWATLPAQIDADNMIARSVEGGVIYVAGSAFFVNGGGHNVIRLAFSAPSHEKIKEGVAQAGGCRARRTGCYCFGVSLACFAAAGEASHNFHDSLSPPVIAATRTSPADDDSNRRRGHEWLGKCQFAGFVPVTALRMVTSLTGPATKIDPAATAGAANGRKRTPCCQRCEPLLRPCARIRLSSPAKKTRSPSVLARPRIDEPTRILHSSSPSDASEP